MSTHVRADSLFAGNTPASACRIPERGKDPRVVTERGRANRTALDSQARVAALAGSF